MSKALTTTDDNLPELASTPAALGNIDGSDVSLPRLYRGEYQSGAVQDGLAKAGCIFVAAGKDDPSPVTIVEDGTKDKGVLVHVLSVFKNLSMQDENDELQRWDFGDPSAPAEAKIGYNFVVALPEVDEDVPAKLLLNKTSTGTANRINFHLLKHAAAGGQPHELAFRLTLKKRESEKGGQKFRWFVWVEELVETPDPEHVKTASRLVALAQAATQQDSKPPAATVVDEGPAI